MIYKIGTATLWVLLGFVLGILLFKSCGKDANAPVIVEPKEIVKQEAAAEQPFKKKYDSLLIEDQKLQSGTVSLKNKLAQERSSRLMAEKELDIAINNLPDSLQKNMQEKANDYTFFSEEAESSCDAVTNNLEKQLRIKDTMLTVKDSLYQTLKSSFNVFFHSNEALLKYNKSLEKGIRKQKAGNLLWKIATGVAAALLIKQSIK